MKHKYLSKKYWKATGTPMGESGDLAKAYDDLINFSLGDPDFTTDERIIEAAFQDARAGHTHYTDFYGDPELRQEIGRFYKEAYGYEVVSGECMITASGCHGMWLVLETLLDEGDEVIIHAPYFTPYPQQIRLARGVPVILETLEEEGFQINVERLEGLITERTKAIIVNTPNNPTGTCFSRETLLGIAKVSMAHDLMVIADDIYTAFSYEEPFLPITTLAGMKERTITIGSFSKDYCMTGWRVGYVLAPDFVVRTMKDVNENNVFTAPSVSQRAALHAMRLREEVQGPIVAAYRERMNYAYDRIRRIANMSVLPPRGSIYLFVNVKGTGLSAAEVTREILEQAHVLVLPGNAFGACGEGYIRVAVTVGLEELQTAFDRIERMPIFSSETV